MKCNNFESFIDQKILARGLEYFKDGYVLSVEEIEHNRYKAEVEGAELYSVEVSLDDEDNIIDTVCDCPYDMGEYCKHQVAVFLTLRDMKCDSPHKNGYSVTQSSTAAAKLIAQQTDITPDIREILAGRLKDELVDFLVDVASDYEEIRRRIELDFFNGNDREEIKQSIKLIRAYIGKNSDRHGFVDYGHVYEAIKGAGLVLCKARATLEKRKSMQAVNLALCVIHEMMELLQSADDSNGAIGGEIEEALSFISEVIKVRDLNPSDKESLFRILVEEATGRRYEGWTDWKLSFLECCSELADTQTLRDECETLLTLTVKSKYENSWRSSYYVERINTIRYDLINKHDGSEKAQEFINENLQYPNFRKLAIESAMQEQDYDSVEQMALEGEKLDHDKCGLVKRWMEYRYAAYQKTGNLEKQRAVASEFILDGSFEYYMELKRTYTPNDWLSIYPYIISKQENQKKTYYALYSQILVEEAEKQKLFEYVQERPSEVERFYIYLLPEFKEGVYTLFLQYIEQTAARSSDRKAYQHVCEIIQSLKKAGGKEQAVLVKQKLLMKYPNKPAFKNELSRV